VRHHPSLLRYLLSDPGTSFPAPIPRPPPPSASLYLLCMSCPPPTSIALLPVQQSLKNLRKITCDRLFPSSLTAPPPNQLLRFLIQAFPSESIHRLSNRIVPFVAGHASVRPCDTSPRGVTIPLHASIVLSAILFKTRGRLLGWKPRTEPPPQPRELKSGAANLRTAP
jgi:hypothetical protein